MGGRTGLHDKLQPQKNNLIFYPSQFPSNSKKLKRLVSGSCWLHSMAKAEPAHPVRQQACSATARCGEQRTAQHCMKAVGGDLTGEWGVSPLWCCGRRRNKGTLFMGTLYTCHLFCTCRSSYFCKLPEFGAFSRGQLSLWQQAMGTYPCQ